MFVWLAGASSCGSRVDLAKVLEVTDVLTGYHDAGVVNGLNKLVPSVAFKLRNTGADPVDSVQLTVAFWEEGADGETESLLVRGIGETGLEPGASTDTINVRGTFGYTYEGARADMFTNSRYRGFIAKLFAKQGGRIVPIGQLKIDPRIIPAAPHEAGRQ
jgi:hypothetical protein